jgi:hypothetical protein
MQSDSDRMQTELKRKTAELDVAAVEKERLLGKLKAAEGFVCLLFWLCLKMT